MFRSRNYVSAAREVNSLLRFSNLLRDCFMRPCGLCRVDVNDGLIFEERRAMRNACETEDISGDGEENSHGGPETGRRHVHSSEGSARPRVRGQQCVSKTSQTSEQDRRGGLPRSRMSEQDQGVGIHRHESPSGTCRKISNSPRTLLLQMSRTGIDITRFPLQLLKTEFLLR